MVPRDETVVREEGSCGGVVEMVFEFGYGVNESNLFSF